MRAVCFLSDYGLDDEYVGVCHGVIKRIVPELTIIDVTHGIPARDVRAGALALQRSLPYLPDAVHLAVVDPGVGSERRPLAIRCDNGTTFVGPNNGLLWPACQSCGGIEVTADLGDSPHRLDDVSATFHGRDVFAPVAAHLAVELPVELAGSPIEPGDVVPLDLPQPAVSEGALVAHVLSIDRFGNVQLNIGAGELGAAGLRDSTNLTIEVEGVAREVGRGTTFADVKREEPVLYEDSSGFYALAVNSGSAAQSFNLQLDSELTLRT